MQSSQDRYYSSLFQLSILRILRAAGFQSARPSVIDLLTHTAGLYLYSLSSTVHLFAVNARESEVSATDVILALREKGHLSHDIATIANAYDGYFDSPKQKIPESHGQSTATPPSSSTAIDTIMAVLVDFLRSAEYKETVRIAGLIPNYDPSLEDSL